MSKMRFELNDVCKNNHMRLHVIVLITLMVLSACGSSKRPDEESLLQAVDTMAIEGPAISEEVIKDVVQQIPSPLEISMLLKEVGTKYDVSLLNSADNISKYNSKYKKALNLGIYGTDLGYTNIYEQNQDAIFYLNSIKDLADGLNIGQFFDFGTIKRLATNSSNLDSLLLLTTQNFNEINAYLQDQKRANLSVLLLTGGWLEAVHLTGQISQKNPDNKALMEKIGEQKIILDNIKLLLEFYKETDPNIGDLYQDMVMLEEAFEEIEIVYTYAEPTFVEVDGMLVFKDNSTTTINITQENVKTISDIVTKIRNKVVS